MLSKTSIGLNAITCMATILLNNTRDDAYTRNKLSFLMYPPKTILARKHPIRVKRICRRKRNERPNS